MSARISCKAGRSIVDAAARLRVKTGIDGSTFESARSIVEEVLSRGDSAIVEFTKRFDGYDLGSMFIDAEDMRSAASSADRGIVIALKKAASNIRRFHEDDMPEKTVVSGKGYRLERRYTPLNSIGIYVPGGRYPYPSTILMAAIPAMIAGVGSVTVATPPGIVGSRSFPAFAAACRIAGIDRVLKVGGAQGVAALAFGTESIPRVDKIVGPGNAYVTAAKAIVSSMGVVGIESLPGPTELLVVADATAAGTERLIAYEMLAQAEHLSGASAVLCTESSMLADAVDAAVRRAIRDEGVDGSLPGALTTVIVREPEDMRTFAEAYAPEHLFAIGKEAERIAWRVRNAGSVFIGKYSSVAFGDYVSGSNHVLPTMGTARFSSPLGVRDFMKSTEFQRIGKSRAEELSIPGMEIAAAEGLRLHAASMMLRSAKGGIDD